MDRVDEPRNDSFSYRCLPLLTGNQQGWEFLAPVGFTVEWDGGDLRASTRITYDEPPPYEFALTHFGSGIVTFQIGCLFRTPKGVNLIVRGPANTPKVGIYALEAVVESDWLVFNSTFNWKMTMADTPVRFEKGEPVGMIVPTPRGFAEQFSPEIRSMAANPELQAAAAAWAGEAAEYRMLNTKKIKWLGRYLRGVDPSGKQVIPDHKRRVHLREFVDKRPGQPEQPERVSSRDAVVKPKPEPLRRYGPLQSARSIVDAIGTLQRLDRELVKADHVRYGREELRHVWRARIRAARAGGDKAAAVEAEKALNAMPSPQAEASHVHLIYAKAAHLRAMILRFLRDEFQAQASWPQGKPFRVQLRQEPAGVFVELHEL